MALFRFEVGGPRAEFSPYSVQKSDLRSFLIIPDAASRDSNSVVLQRARICIFNAFSDDTDAGVPLTTSEAN